MPGVYDSLQPGDHVYFVEQYKVAFCQVVKVNRHEARPDFTEYVLDIVEQWYEHERFETMPILLFGKRFTVSRTAGVAYSGMWQFYTAQQFEHFYGHLPGSPENVAQIKFELTLRRIILGCATLLLLLLMIGVSSLIARMLN